ncbi:hypothetical protein GTY59_27440, partial [Streptomyces sp. SID5466]|nr:hypothetical protein [Streptomyces sp. SID5466]
MAIEVADAAGAPVASIESLTTRVMEEGAAGRHAHEEQHSLYRIAWTARPGSATASATSSPSPAAAAAGRRCAVTGTDPFGLAAALGTYESAETGSEAGSEAGTPVTVFLSVATDAGQPVADSAHSAVQEVLRQVQHWLADEPYADARL